MELVLILQLVVFIVCLTTEAGSSVSSSTRMDNSRGSITQDFVENEVLEMHKRRGRFRREAPTSSQWAELFVVPYEINTTLINSEFMRNIHQAFEDIAKYSCVKFVKKHDLDEYYIHIARKVDCFANLGLSLGKNVVMLSATCSDVGGILHELMHALGFIHEHQRSDRNKHIEIIWNNMPKPLSTDALRQISARFSAINSYGLPYDYKSVMHYKNKANSKDGHVTIRSRIHPAMELGGTKLTEFDIQRINARYQCSSMTPPPPPPSPMTTTTTTENIYMTSKQKLTTTTKKPTTTAKQATTTTGIPETTTTTTPKETLTTTTEKPKTTQKLTTTTEKPRTSTKTLKMATTEKPIPTTEKPTTTTEKPTTTTTEKPTTTSDEISSTFIKTTDTPVATTVKAIVTTQAQNTTEEPTEEAIEASIEESIEEAIAESIEEPTEKPNTKKKTTQTKTPSLSTTTSKTDDVSETQAMKQQTTTSARPTSSKIKPTPSAVFRSSAMPQFSVLHGTTTVKYALKTVISSLHKTLVSSIRKATQRLSMSIQTASDINVAASSHPSPAPALTQSVSINTIASSRINPDKSIVMSKGDIKPTESVSQSSVLVSVMKSINIVTYSTSQPTQRLDTRTVTKTSVTKTIALDASPLLSTRLTTSYNSFTTAVSKDDVTQSTAQAELRASETIKTTDICRDVMSALECEHFKNLKMCTNTEFSAYFRANCQRTCAVCQPHQ